MLEALLEPKNYLKVMHHEDCITQRNGWLIGFGENGGFHFDTITTIEDPDIPGYDGLDFKLWPRSLWGYFPSQEAAVDAIREAGLEHMIQRSPEKP